MRIAALAPLVLFAILVAFPPALAAQDTAPSGDAPAGEGSAPAEASAEEQDLFLLTVALDIYTSSYYELVDWCRALGLSDSGDAQALRERLYKHYGVQAPSFDQDAGFVVTIVSARKTEYFTIESTKDDVIRLTGGVEVRVREAGKSDEHVIQAEEVVYNKTLNTLTARGNVKYERKSGSGTEIFYGQSLTIDLDTWQGRFFEGETSLAPSGDGGSALTFSADEISRSEGGVLVLEDAVITSCEEEHPHYSIRAGKVWILGPNEWAIADATLRIGEIPYLWIPFFYYPGEDIVFNPVFGVRDREGYFVQTTTYLLGEKQASEESISFFKLTKGADGLQKEVKGVFLRTTDRPSDSSGSKDLFKVMADIYVNLGFFLGADGKFEWSGSLLERAEFKFGLGLSRSVFLTATGWSPYSEAGDFESVWNFVPFMGMLLPFRVGVESSFAFRAGPWSATLALPIYTDPFFNADFRFRSEEMRWLRFLEQGEDSSPPGEVSSFVQRLEQKFAFNFGFLSPWISSVTLNPFVTTFIWQAKPDTGSSLPAELKAVDPFRRFYYPDRATLLSTSVSLQGTIFSLVLSGDPGGGSSSSASSSPSSATSGSTSAASKAFELLPPWWQPAVKDEAAPVAPASSSGSSAAAPTTPAAPTTGSRVVEGGGMVSEPRAKDIEAAAIKAPFSLTLAWAFGPKGSWDVVFASSKLITASEVDFRALTELLLAEATGSMTLTAKVYEGLVQASAKLSGSGKSQLRLLTLDDPDYANDVANFPRLDAEANRASFQLKLEVAISPFLDAYFWAPTSFTYAFEATLYSARYVWDAGTATLVESALFAPDGSFDDSLVTSHKAGFVLGIQPWEQLQKLVVAMDLPPKSDSVSFSCDLKAGPLAVNASTKYFYSEARDEYLWDKLAGTATLSLGALGTFTDTFQFDIDAGYPLSQTVSYSGLGMGASFEMLRSTGFDRGPTGWAENGIVEFRPSAFRLSWALDLDLDAFWLDRIFLDLKINASYRQNLLKFTESSMSFDFQFILKIHEFLDIELRAYTVNSQVYRYFPWLFGADDIVAVDPLMDIIGSFDFFDPDAVARRKALFKLGTISLTLTHYLDDWKAVLTLSAAPKLNTATRLYEFVPTITFLIAWDPIPEFKTTISQTPSEGLVVR